MRIKLDASQRRVRFSRGKFKDGKNHSSKIVGPRGRRVRIPRSADSFKSRTDNT